MSYVEGNEHMEAIAKVVAKAAAVEEAVATILGAAPAEDLGGCMYFEPVLREAIRSALFQAGLSCGLHETIKALGKGQALLCIKAENCDDDDAYKKYVQALCQEHQIPFLNVPKNMRFGKYARFCKSDDKGNERKVDQCSFVLIKNWGKKFLTLDLVNERIKKNFESNSHPDCSQQHAVGQVRQRLQG